MGAEAFSGSLPCITTAGAVTPDSEEAMLEHEAVEAAAVTAEAEPALPAHNAASALHSAASGAGAAPAWAQP